MGPKNKDKKGTKYVSDTPETLQTTQDSNIKAAVATDAVTLQTMLNKMNTLSMDMKCMDMKCIRDQRRH